MKTYFTVDRRGGLNSGESLQLIRDYSPYTCYEVSGVFNKDDLVFRLQTLYPEGLSRHGVQYLMESCLIIPDLQTGQSLRITPLEPVIETIFEQVRINEFPHRPSRMQAMFAWSSLKDASRFRGSAENHLIYQVESSSAFVADMNLLHLGGSLVGAYEYAKKYWSGNKSDNPNLEVLIPLPVVIGDVIQPVTGYE